jgi:hypothetical protein
MDSYNSCNLSTADGILLGNATKVTTFMSVVELR